MIIVTLACNPLMHRPNANSFIDLIRTRDTTLLETCDIVVDVGAVYDASKLRFDHHQRGFNTTFGNGFQTKLSSAGLVYKLVYLPLAMVVFIFLRHFGKEVLANHAQIPVDDPHIEPLWLKLYEVCSPHSSEA